jgi:RNase adaptor protein for sRNA GlmZ degradation
VIISILSFSYKRGLPEDETGNGGGFVFDCRAMPNPFWDEALRGYSGCDKLIVKFFEQHKDRVDCFLDAPEVLVRQSIEQYQKDGRDYLQIAFGCTGGQHRSVLEITTTLLYLMAGLKLRVYVIDRYLMLLKK